MRVFSPKIRFLIGFEKARFDDIIELADLKILFKKLFLKLFKKLLKLKDRRGFISAYNNTSAFLRY